MSWCASAAAHMHAHARPCVRVYVHALTRSCCVRPYMHSCPVIHECVCVCARVRVGPVHGCWPRGPQGVSVAVLWHVAAVRPMALYVPVCLHARFTRVYVCMFRVYCATCPLLVVQHCGAALCRCVSHLLASPARSAHSSCCGGRQTKPAGQPASPECSYFRALSLVTCVSVPRN